MVFPPRWFVALAGQGQRPRLFGLSLVDLERPRGRPPGVGICMGSFVQS